MYCQHFSDIWNALTILFYPPVVLYMFFLYCDDGSHFEHNKIPHKMTCGLVSIRRWPFNKVTITKKDKDRMAVDDRGVA